MYVRYRTYFHLNKFLHIFKSSFILFFTSKASFHIHDCQEEANVRTVDRFEENKENAAF